MSWHLFTQQEVAYRQQILPEGTLARVSVEACATLGWERWVGSAGRSVGLNHFGASAPSQSLFQEFGIHTNAVVAAAREVLS